MPLGESIYTLASDSVRFVRRRALNRRRSTRPVVLGDKSALGQVEETSESALIIEPRPSSLCPLVLLVSEKTPLLGKLVNRGIGSPPGLDSSSS